MNLALQWVLLGCSLVFLSNFITHLKNLNFNSWLLKGQNDCYLHLPLSDLISLPFWSYYLKSKQGIPSVLSPGRVAHLYRIIYCGTSWVTPHPVDGQSAVKAKSTESMWMYRWLCRILSSEKPEGCALLWSLWPRSQLGKHRSSSILTWVRKCIPTPSASQLLLTHPPSASLTTAPLSLSD